MLDRKERAMNVGIKDPVRLYAEPIGFEGNRWALVAESANGDRITIIASGERFRDALMTQGLGPIMSEAEQVRAMFVRDEVGVEALERALERDLRR